MISHATHPTINSPTLAPVTPNAWHALGGVWRLTVRRAFAPAQWLGTAALMTIVGLPAFAIPHAGNPKFFAPQLAFGFYLAFLVPTLAFLLGAGAVREEMKAEAVDYVLTRPVGRAPFLLFKFVSHLACVQLGCLPPLAVLVAAGIHHHVPQALALVPWLLLGQVMIITAFSAFGFLSGVLTARFMVIGILYAGIVEFAVSKIPTQLNRIAMTRQLKMMLQPMLAWSDPALKPEQPVWMCIAVLLGLAVSMVAVGAAIFSQRELTGARPSEL